MNKKTPFILILGPSLLVLTLIMLLAKTAFLLGRPVWIFGLCFSSAISVLITYLGFNERHSREKEGELARLAKEKELDDMRGLLEETQALYQKKIAQLEEANGLIENELTLRDQEIEEMKVDLEKLYDETNQAKQQASAFRNSLEDALDELRGLRQIRYLEKENAKQVPKDLVQQHKQLRGQFEEKSLILEQTRRRLFALEGQLFALKKERSNEMLSDSEEEVKLIEMVKKLSLETASLEAEISLLQEIITMYTTTQKKNSSKAKKKLDQMLDLQFDIMKD